QTCVLPNICLHRCMALADRSIIRNKWYLNEGCYSSQQIAKLGGAWRVTETERRTSASSSGSPFHDPFQIDSGEENPAFQMRSRWECSFQSGVRIVLSACAKTLHLLFIYGSSN
ncbi:hypothetical protein CEXT_672661, partial [Caerostris extrusa]